MTARGLECVVVLRSTAAAWHGSPSHASVAKWQRTSYTCCCSSPPPRPSPRPILPLAGTFDLAVCCNGLMAGLSASTTNVGFVTPWASCINGALAGLLYVLTSHMLVSPPECARKASRPA